MRQLKSLCRRLSRLQGCTWCVVSHSRCNYAVFSGNGLLVGRGVFRTVSETRSFLLSQFR